MAWALGTKHHNELDERLAERNAQGLIVGIGYDRATADARWAETEKTAGIGLGFFGLAATATGAALLLRGTRGGERAHWLPGTDGRRIFVTASF